MGSIIYGYVCRFLNCRRNACISFTKLTILWRNIRVWWFKKEKCKACGWAWVWTPVWLESLLFLPVTSWDSRVFIIFKDLHFFYNGTPLHTPQTQLSTAQGNEKGSDRAQLQHSAGSETQRSCFKHMSLSFWPFLVSESHLR